MDNNKQKKSLPLIVVVAAICVLGLVITAAASSGLLPNSDHEKKTVVDSSIGVDPSTQYIGELAAKKIAVAKVSGSAITDVKEIYFEFDDGIAEYDGDLFFNSQKYEFKINAQNGNVIEWEIKGNTEVKSSDATSSATSKASTSSAIKEVKKSSNDAVSTATTKGSSNSSSITDSSIYIGEAKARLAALAKVPGATITEIYLENDDNRVEYDGEMYLGNVKYDFTIDAKTGAVLELESEVDDDSDSSQDDSSDDSSDGDED